MKKNILLNRDLILFLILVFIFLLVGFLNPLFFTYDSLLDVLNDSSLQYLEVNSGVYQRINIKGNILDM